MDRSYDNWKNSKLIVKTYRPSMICLDQEFVKEVNKIIFDFFFFFFLGGGGGLPGMDFNLIQETILPISSFYGNLR